MNKNFSIYTAIKLLLLNRTNPSIKLFHWFKFNQGLNTNHIVKTENRRNSFVHCSSRKPAQTCSVNRPMAFLWAREPSTRQATSWVWIGKTKWLSGPFTPVQSILAAHPNPTATRHFHSIKTGAEFAGTLAPTILTRSFLSLSHSAPSTGERKRRSDQR
jgi:hypothetical protein